MKIKAYQKLIDQLNNTIEPISAKTAKYAALLEKIGDARFVLIGEATHGAQEFYQARAEITQQLIEKKDFMAVAIEADWPDAYRIHRYLQGVGDNEINALDGFKRFPTWMWRNTAIPPFIKWLRNYNDQLSPTAKVGFYGLHQDGLAAEDEYFYATQNARLIKDAEVYYHSMFEDHISLWNVRDTHMAETVNVIADHLENRVPYQFDSIIHFDQTDAVQPLEINPEWR